MSEDQGSNSTPASRKGGSSPSSTLLVSAEGKGGKRRRRGPGARGRRQSVVRPRGRRRCQGDRHPRDSRSRQGPRAAPRTRAQRRPVRLDRPSPGGRPWQGCSSGRPPRRRLEGRQHTPPSSPPPREMLLTADQPPGLCLLTSPLDRRPPPPPVAHPLINPRPPSSCSLSPATSSSPSRTPYPAGSHDHARLLRPPAQDRPPRRPAHAPHVRVHPAGRSAQNARRAFSLASLTSPPPPPPLLSALAPLTRLRNVPQEQVRLALSSGSLPRSRADVPVARRYPSPPGPDRPRGHLLLAARLVRRLYARLLRLRNQALADRNLPSRTVPLGLRRKDGLLITEGTFIAKEVRLGAP